MIEKATEDDPAPTRVLYSVMQTIRCSLFLLSIGALGCARYTSFQGFVTAAEGTVVATKPPPPATSPHAFVLRDDYTNALDVSIAQEDRDQLSSTVRYSKMVLLTFTRNSDFPTDAVSVFMPLVGMGGIQLRVASISDDHKHLTVGLATDELGVDLIRTLIFSPQGIKGVALFPASGHAITLQARADQPWFVWASVWRNPRSPHSTKLLVRSESEFPVLLDGISYRAAGEQHAQVLEGVIGPWAEKVITLDVSVDTIEWNSFRMAGRSARVIPRAFSPTFQTHP